MLSIEDLETFRRDKHESLVIYFTPFQSHLSLYYSLIPTLVLRLSVIFNSATPWSHIIYSINIHYVQSLFSCVQLFVISWTVACQAPQPMEFSRQEYWGGLPFPTPGDLPDPGIKPVSPALADGFFTTVPPGKPTEAIKGIETFTCLFSS